jgi:phosphoglycerate dehydrogenase-like enzyme
MLTGPRKDEIMTESAPSTVAIAFDPGAAGRAVIADALGQAAAPVYLHAHDDPGRAAVLSAAAALLAYDTGKELRPGEAIRTGHLRLIQFMTAGVDHIPLSQLPPHVPLANNGGAYAEAMAEHALALALAGAKRLLIEHKALAEGTFNQFARNRTLRGGICGILGFGGIGRATARLMRAMGMRIYAINRHGASEESVDWIGTPDHLSVLLAGSDVLIVAAPLTRRTLGMIGAAEFACMKPDAILINLARGELIDETALFTHLRAHPAFFAGIDAWWVEPVRHGAFRLDHPFLTLPNVIGSPHNSASVRGNLEGALRQALGNILRVLGGEAPRNVVGAEERMS